MLKAMQIDDISKEQFIRDNLTGKLRDKIIINKLEKAIWDSQLEAKEAILMGDINSVLHYCNQQNFFKEKLTEYLEKIK